MAVLKGKNIVLGVTGSIAAYKSAEIVRELVTGGAHTRVVMTESARQFIGPQTLATLSGQKVLTRMFGDGTDPEIDHIRVPEKADAILIAPATANIIAKMASGIADDMLSTMMLVARCPILVAPAMNSNMYTHPATEENVEKLKNRGIKIIEPDIGELACGYTGPGRLALPSDIIEELRAALTVPDMKGLRVLVTAGPTREAIDPVRYISNRSSGKMGYAVARAAIRHGAEVTVVGGPTGVAAPRKAALISVETAEEMEAACEEAFEETDVLVMAAAVADYRPQKVAGTKIKKTGNGMSVKLAPCPDILKGLSESASPRQVMVGFAAETDDVLINAKKKIDKKKLDLLVANKVNTPDSGFDHDTNRIRILDSKGGVEPYPLMTKDEAAEIIVNHILKCIESKRG